MLKSYWQFRRDKLKSIKWMELGGVRIWLHIMLLLSSCGWDKLCKCLPFSHNKKSCSVSFRIIDKFHSGIGIHS